MRQLLATVLSSIAFAFCAVTLAADAPGLPTWVNVAVCTVIAIGWLNSLLGDDPPPRDEAWELLMREHTSATREKPKLRRVK